MCLIFHMTVDLDVNIHNITQLSMHILAESNPTNF